MILRNKKVQVKVKYKKVIFRVTEELVKIIVNLDEDIKGRPCFESVINFYLLAFFLSFL